MHYLFNLIFNNTNIIIKKREITRFATTFFFVAKNISSHKFNLSTFVFVESIILKVTIIIETSLLFYRFVLFSSFTYQLYKKLYFTIVDLYMRYTSLNKPLFNKITRIIIVFFIIFMQNLYEKFHNKKKRIIFIINKILNFSIKQYAIR